MSAPGLILVFSLLAILPIACPQGSARNFGNFQTSQEYFDFAISTGKARLFTQENKTGAFEDAFNILTPEKCTNLQKFTETTSFPVIKSIETFGTCVRVYDQPWCQGQSLAVYPGSPFEDEIDKSGLKPIKSIGLCLENEFENAQLVQTPNGFTIVKDPPLISNFFTPPDLLQIRFSPAVNTTVAYPPCKIVQYKRGYKGRIEYVRTAIEREDLNDLGHFSDDKSLQDVLEFYKWLDKKEGDVLGYALPLEFSGPVETPFVYSVNKNVWKAYQNTIVDKVRGIFQGNETVARVYLAVNFVYFNETSTRPDLISYWIVEELGDGARFYNLVRNSESMEDFTDESRDDKQFKDSVLGNAKAKFEFFRNGTVVDKFELDFSRTSAPVFCKNFARFQQPNDTFSVDTSGTCIRLFDYSNCRGISVAIYPGGVQPNNAPLPPINDNSKNVISIGRCLPEEFINSKVVAKEGEKIIAKKFSTEPFSTTPDILFDVSGEYKQAPLAPCPFNQVSFKSVKGQPLTDFIAAELIPKFIGNVTKTQISVEVLEYFSSLKKNPGDVLGYAIPPEFGGPIKVFNVFPQTEAFQTKLFQAFTNAANLVNRIDGNPTVALSFLYRHGTSRPSAVLYQIRDGQGYNVKVGFIKN